MFVDILVTVLEIFIASPEAFFNITEKLITYINDNHLLPFVYGIGFSIIVVRNLIESDSFALVSSLMQLTTIAILAYFLLQNWNQLVPEAGMSVANEFVYTIAENDDDSNAPSVDGACARFNASQGRGNTIDNPPSGADEEGNRLSDAACYLGEKVGKAIDQLTTPIMTDLEISAAEPSEPPANQDDLDILLTGP